jgi:hypothetical protein
MALPKPARFRGDRAPGSLAGSGPPARRLIRDIRTASSPAGENVYTVDREMTEKSQLDAFLDVAAYIHWPGCDRLASGGRE